MRVLRAIAFTVLVAYSSLWLDGTQGPAVSDELSLVFGGDVLIGRPFSRVKDAQFLRVIQIFQRADASFVNLEEVTSNVGTRDPDVREAIRVDPQMLSEMEWAGVDAVSLGNNHSMNYGPEGLLGTIRELNALGIRHAGGGRNLEEAQSLAILDVKGTRVGMLSLYSGTVGSNSVENAGKERPGLFVLRASDVNVAGKRIVAPVAADLETMERVIETARPKVDILIVSVHSHWGNNTFKEEFADYHPMVARAAIDAGADLFLFHGPHVPRGIEAYKRGFIAYSLGNLFYDLKHLESVTLLPGDLQDETYQSIVVRALVKNGRVHRLELVPIYISQSGDYEGLPRIPDPAKANEILSRLQRLSSITKTRLVLQNGIAHAEAGNP